MAPMTRVPPPTARDVLRLRLQLGFSIREAARGCGVGIATAHAIVQRAEAAGITWPLASLLDDVALANRLYPPGLRDRAAGKPHPDLAEAARARHAGTPLIESWRAYRAAHPGRAAYSYSHFCQMVKSFQRHAHAGPRPSGRGTERRRRLGTPSCVRHGEGAVVSRF